MSMAVCAHLGFPASHHLYMFVAVRQHPGFGHGYKWGFGAVANIHRLHEKQVRNAKPDRGRRSILLPDGANLHLQATLGRDGSVNRSWVFRYQFDGERHDLGLGPLHTTGLADARTEAKRLRQQIIAGIDPLQARREAERERLAQKAAQAKAVTFKECCEQNLRLHSGDWKSAKHGAEWSTTLKSYAFPVLADLAVADIETGHVQRVLEPIWQRIPETARRVRGRIEVVLIYATAAKFRHGDNPANWDVLQHLLPGKKTTTHHPALPFVEAPAFFAELRGRDSATSRALAFTILAAARTSEALGARWDEIDLEAKCWTVPAQRMKSAREHRVPLGDSAIALLKSLPRHSAHSYVFHASGQHNKPLDSKAMRELLRAMRPHATVHGFRSAFSDWAHERTPHANHTIELSLAHAIGNAVEKAYRRGDLFEKRRRLMADWDRFLTSPIPAEGAGVVHLATAKR
jgi:integrase